MNIVPSEIELADRAHDVTSGTPRPHRNAVMILEPADAHARRIAAISDVIGGFKLWRLAVTLGWLDIKLRYRGSVLGPFWLTLSTAVMVAALGIVWSTLFKTNMSQYLPFLGLSLVLWGSGINGLAVDACSAFTQAEGTIRSIRMPYTVQIIRTMVRNVIVFAHNLVVPVAVFALYDSWPGLSAFWSLPGLVLWLVDGVAACMLLGAVSARFRDIPPIVGSIMQIAFYVTPIIWKPSQLAFHPVWMDFNPFDSLLDVVRGPLLGNVPTLRTWGLATGYSIALALVSWLAFVRARGRLAFWV